jgi:hypothetical protein
MKPARHMIASGVFATVFYLYIYNRTFWPAIICFISGFIIDLDHYLDFYLDTGKKATTLGELSSYCEELRFRRYYLLLHSFDLIILFWIVIVIFNLNIFWIALSLGITQHLVLDQLMNRHSIKPFTYFFIFRLVNNFNTNSLFYKKKT